MDATRSEEEREEDGLESSEASVGGFEEGWGGSRGENTRPEVFEEGCHGYVVSRRAVQARVTQVAITIVLLLLLLCESRVAVLFFSLSFSFVTRRITV